MRYFNIPIFVIFTDSYVTKLERKLTDLGGKQQKILCLVKYRLYTSLDIYSAAAQIAVIFYKYNSPDI